MAAAPLSSLQTPKAQQLFRKSFKYLHHKSARCPPGQRTLLPLMLSISHGITSLSFPTWRQSARAVDSPSCPSQGAQSCGCSACRHEQQGQDRWGQDMGTSPHPQSPTVPGAAASKGIGENSERLRALVQHLWHTHRGWGVQEEALGGEGRQQRTPSWWPRLR